MSTTSPLYLSDDEDEGNEIKKARKLNSYTTAYKLEAINYAKQVSIHSASTKFHVDRKRVREWIKNEKKLLDCKWKSSCTSYGCLFGLDLHGVGYCGITNCHDGSEDDLIHCFKSYGSVPEGRSMLRDARADLEECRLAEEIDKAQDEENGYISDESLELDWNDELNAPNPDFHAF
uniref:HTH psq-type domain-containing protein n=1 Tax=Ditylenchus dipsaci TaxID=166011 RepID=A0A915EG86_9BILA